MMLNISWERKLFPLKPYGYSNVLKRNIQEKEFFCCLPLIFSSTNCSSFFFFSFLQQIKTSGTLKSICLERQNIEVTFLFRGWAIIYLYPANSVTTLFFADYIILHSPPNIFCMVKMILVNKLRGVIVLYLNVKFLFPPFLSPTS